MADIVTGQIFQDGEKGITAAKQNGIIGKAVIQPDFYQSKPISTSMDPADIFLLLKGNGAFAQVQAVNVSQSVSGTLALANTSSSGMLSRTSGNVSDYLGGDNAFHPLPGVPTGTVLDFAGSSAPTGFLFCDGSILNVANYPTLGAILGATYGGDGTTTFGLPDCRGRAIIGSGTGTGLTNRVLASKGGEENHALTGAETGPHVHGMDHYHLLNNHVHNMDHAHQVDFSQVNHGHTIPAGALNHSHTIPAAFAVQAGSGANFIGTGGSQPTGTWSSPAIGVTAAGFGVGGTGTASAAGYPNTGGPNVNNTNYASQTNAAWVNTQSAGNGQGHNTMPPFIVFNKIIKT